MAEGTDTLVYCLTRDRELAAAVEERLAGALPFFYNDAARLHQAVILRRPGIVLVDTGAIREEYGDGGLAPVVAFLRERAPEARLTVRPAPGADRLVAAEAGPHVELLPHDRSDCVERLASICAPSA